MPGVLVIEAIAQAGALAIFRLEDLPIQLMMASLSRAKLRVPVVPGMRLMLEVEVVKDRGKIVVFSGKAKVNGDVVAEVEMMAHIQTNVREKSK